MKALECSQHFSHCKSMGKFSGAQGQLTPQCMVRLGLILKSVQTLWLSSLPAKMKKSSFRKWKSQSLRNIIHWFFRRPMGSLLRNLLWNLTVIQTHPSFNACPYYLQDMEKIQSKMMALQWPQGYMSIFLRRPRADNSIVNGVIWLEIRTHSCKYACSHYRAKMKKIQSKMKALWVTTTYDISPIVSLLGFSKRSRAANSAVHGPIRLNLELSPDFMVVLVTCKSRLSAWPKFELCRVYGCPCYLNEWRNGGARVATRFSPLYPYWSYLLPWKAEF